MGLTIGNRACWGMEASERPQNWEELSNPIPAIVRDEHGGTGEAGRAPVTQDLSRFKCRTPDSQWNPLPRSSA